jgi:hypothetical protein
VPENKKAAVYFHGRGTATLQEEEWEDRRTHTPGVTHMNIDNRTTHTQFDIGTTVFIEV